MISARTIDTTRYKKVGAREFQSIPVDTIFLIPTWGFYTRTTKKNGYNAVEKLDPILNRRPHHTSVAYRATVIEYMEPKE